MRWWLLVMACLLANCTYVETTREVGHKGRARVNPYLAAERFLEDYGYRVRNDPGWPDLDEPLGMVVLPASILSADGYIEALESWIEWGGHAVITLEHGEGYINDWDGGRRGGAWNDRETADAFDAWMKRLGYGVESEDLDASFKSPKAGEFVRLKGRRYEVWMESRSRITTQGGKGRTMVSRELGEGRLTLVNDARPFRNRYIGDYDHAELLLTLMELSEYGDEVVFVRNASLSFWSLIWSRAWPAMLVLLLFVAAWLWKNLPRFGPLDAHEDSRALRAYDHHLEALGDFHWRLDRAQGLLRPLREGLLERTQALALASGRRDADVFGLMAERSGISRERAERAMTFERARDSASFTRLVADLQTIHTSIP